MWHEVVRSGEGSPPNTDQATINRSGKRASGWHMFLGEFLHSLDPKGRLILPARFRELLTQAYVTSQMDGCLALWTPAEFQARAEDMNHRAKGSADERNMARVFFAHAQEANPDRQGRIAIPQNLRLFAGLDLESQVVVTGAWDHVEIWDVATWDRTKGAGESALLGAGATSPGDGPAADGAPEQP